MMKALKIVWAISLSTIFVLSATAADKHAPHWEYEGADGPAHWGSLSKEFATCELGKEQSPVNIPSKAAKKTDLPPIKTAYHSSAGELVNNGHTVQVTLADGGDATVPSGKYKLLQFHFHTPSEEKIDGKSFSMVAHMVHKNGTGKLAVIAVLIQEGKENAALKQIFDALPAEGSKTPLKSNFDATRLLPANMGYYTLQGSLTTPPCTEGVAWQILETPIEMSKAQISAFQKLYKMNARPVQPLNGRIVQVVD